MNFHLKVSDELSSYLVKRENYLSGIHYVYMFPNGYGASIIKNVGSYGYNRDLWELAVIMDFGYGKYELVYDTPITDDVLGHLTDEDVEATLYSIMKLERRIKNERREI